MAFNSFVKLIYLYDYSWLSLSVCDRPHRKLDLRLNPGCEIILGDRHTRL
ncbi:hypothetical protein [Microcoleus sp. bin38.metabat.b11b12b14.051]|nr:hypothetical protein [Microcoleus sp. bin38.metabat.b11b12b14.051]